MLRVAVPPHESPCQAGKLSLSLGLRVLETLLSKGVSVYMQRQSRLQGTEAHVPQATYPRVGGVHVSVCCGCVWSRCVCALYVCVCVDAQVCACVAHVCICICVYTQIGVHAAVCYAYVHVSMCTRVPTVLCAPVPVFYGYVCVTVSVCVRLCMRPGCLRVYTCSLCVPPSLCGCVYFCVSVCLCAC